MFFGEGNMLKIVVDAMGGDNAPSEIVKGALDALADRGDFKIILTGDEALVKLDSRLSKSSLPEWRRPLR